MPENEAERLDALASYDVADTLPEQILSDLTTLAAKICDTAFAGIMLLDADVAWLVGSNQPIAPKEVIARSSTVCTHTILDPARPMIIPDLVTDPRVGANSFAAQRGFRAYAGVPLVNPEGYALGALCVMDYEARLFEPDAIEKLQTLARAVSSNLELRRALKLADRAARTDPLTGLPNRRIVMRAIEEFTRRETPMTAIAIDLDFFKETNDSAGHAAGDTVLRVTGARLLAALPSGAIAARLGGDEFLVLLPDVVDRDHVTATARVISAALHVPVAFGNEQLRVGATLGVAMYPACVEQADRLVRVADEVMLRAKQEDRGSIGFAAHEDGAKLTTAVAILRAFEVATSAPDQVEHATAALQPIIRMSKDGSKSRLLALEALTRWQHPSLGNIAPDELFSVIGPERALVISRAVRQQSFKLFLALRPFLGDARLALNLSASEVMRADTAEILTHEVEQAGLSLHDIEVEITEEVLLERVSDRALEQLAALRGRGARLVLDDFGTGSSGLSQLLRLPLDGLKLDKQFVQRLGGDSRAEEIVKATLSLARSLGLEMVAEGIETVQQATILRSLGCTAAQGYLYGRPMFAADLPRWLAEHADGHDNVVELPRRVG